MSVPIYSEIANSDTLTWGSRSGISRFRRSEFPQPSVERPAESTYSGHNFVVAKRFVISDFNDRRPAMERFSKSNPVRVAVIGAVAVSDYHHVPGANLDPRARLVAACDADQSLLDKRKTDWSLEDVTSDYEKICADPVT